MNVYVVDPAYISERVESLSVTKRQNINNHNDTSLVFPMVSRFWRFVHRTDVQFCAVCPYF